MFVFKPCFIFFQKKNHATARVRTWDSAATTQCLNHSTTEALPTNVIPKTPILHSHWPIHTCPSCLICIRHFQPITFHKRRFSILIGPFLIDSCQSNDVTGDLHKIWTNHRPFQVQRHPLLLLASKLITRHFNGGFWPFPPLTADIPY